MRLQYLAGMSLNTNMGEQILASILRYYRFPDQTFVGPREAVESLRQALEQMGRTESERAPESTSR